jgi:hypothetical protein
MTIKVLAIGLLGLCLALAQAYADNLPVGGQRAALDSLAANSVDGFSGIPQAQASDLENLNNAAVRPIPLLDFFYQIQRPSSNENASVSHETEIMGISNVAPAPKPGLYGLVALALAGLVFAIQLFYAKAKNKASASAATL